MAETSFPAPTASHTETSTTEWQATSWITFYLYLVALFALVYYLYQRATQETWTQYGVKEPKLSLLFAFGEDFRSKFSQLLNTYGDIVGLRQRSKLTLVTSNLSLMKHILVKDFGNFVERSENLRSQSPFAKSLFFARQGEWKRHRQIVSPTFTTGKLRNIAKLVDISAQSLESYLEKSARDGKLVPIKDLASRYTGEIIAKAAFGLNVKFIDTDDHEFLNYATTMIKVQLGFKRVIFQLLDSIPNAVNICLKLLPNIQFFDPINFDANEYFKTTLRNTITERLKQQKEGVTRRQVDFLDLLLKANDAAKEGKLENDEDDESKDKADKAWEGLVSAMTDEEVLGHSMLIIFAGMETTATTLQLSLCQLARHPHFQERAYQEIRSVVKSDTPSAEELGNLHFLEQVINETLRMHPPAPVVNRRALETRTYDGVTIPKGAGVIIPYYHVMTDPKLYPDPMTFNPDRFSPEEKEKRDPMAFIPFGHGPRQCLGMRLAYLELKVALVHVLRNLKAVVNDTTVPRKGGKLKFSPQGLLTPVEKIMLAFELRE